MTRNWMKNVFSENVSEFVINFGPRYVYSKNWSYYFPAVGRKYTWHVGLDFRLNVNLGEEFGCN